MDINFLVKLTSRAWSLKILALFHQGVAGRQAPLLHASCASRTAFAQSLTHLIELGLVERNPGHGHPIRPEFRLTDQGARVAKLADRIERLAPDKENAVLLRRSWTVPILAVTQQQRFFSELKSDLPRITDRALSTSLQKLEQHRLVERRIDLSERRPRPVYQTIETGQEIGALLGIKTPPHGSHQPHV